MNHFNHCLNQYIDLPFSEFARIQFRLPDGSSVTNQFSSSDSLDAARAFITEVLILSISDIFSVKTATICINFYL